MEDVAITDRIFKARKRTILHAKQWSVKLIKIIEIKSRNFYSMNSRNGHRLRHVHIERVSPLRYSAISFFSILTKHMSPRGAACCARRARLRWHSGCWASRSSASACRRSTSRPAASPFPCSSRCSPSRCSRTDQPHRRLRLVRKFQSRSIPRGGFRSPSLTLSLAVVPRHGDSSDAVLVVYRASARFCGAVRAGVCGVISASSGSECRGG